MAHSDFPFFPHAARDRSAPWSGVAAPEASSQVRNVISQGEKPDFPGPSGGRREPPDGAFLSRGM
jgi:hypothetical protein